MRRRVLYPDGDRIKQNKRMLKLPEGPRPLPWKHAQALRQRMLGMRRHPRERVPSVPYIAVACGPLRYGKIAGKDRMHGIELSVEETARLTGVSESTISLVYHWLERIDALISLLRTGDTLLEGCTEIGKHKKLRARCVRTDAQGVKWGLFKLYRTSKRWLTDVGVGLFGLASEALREEWEARHGRRVRGFTQFVEKRQMEERELERQELERQQKRQDQLIRSSPAPQAVAGPVDRAAWLQFGRDIGLL